MNRFHPMTKRWPWRTKSVATTIGAACVAWSVCLALFASPVHSAEPVSMSNADGGTPADEVADTSVSVVRVATFNTALNRKAPGKLVAELTSGESKSGRQIAETIQRVRPHVLLLNEVDYDEAHAAIDQLHDVYLMVGQNGQAPIEYPHRYAAPVNTGVPSGLDLDGDRRTNGPGDAWGYGQFPGQYGMVVLSQFPIRREKVRTLQKFLWKDMPRAMLPVDSQTGESFYSEPALKRFRLSSKSHWDVPVELGDTVVHFLVSHPTPPVFDGPEDRNGRRNHDEIRLWADYIDPERSEYIYDDQGRRGGLEAGANFVIAGDLNADPVDGDSTGHAIDQLLKHPMVQGDLQPQSDGARTKAARDGRANLRQHGAPALDTSDFSDRTSGNLRIDYVLPSRQLKVTQTGVFWPTAGQPGSHLMDASDHRLVWIDIEL